MKLVPTRRADYGIRAMLYMAEHAEGPAKAKTIADFMAIPTGFLRQVLQALKRTGLVHSQSGRSGGYSLAKPPVEISILEIIEALEGPLDSGECALRGGPCHWVDVCALHEVWSESRTAFRQTLAAATLAEVARSDRAKASSARDAPKDGRRRQDVDTPAGEVHRR